MYVYVHVCMCAYVYVCHMYTCVSMHTYVCVYVLAAGLVPPARASLQSHVLR